ncbi:MAG: STT3 domain-containing protein, partial [FCB group bacterium]|nr:STT3 domain-containing protein [FCB group bacterium]
MNQSYRWQSVLVWIGLVCAMLLGLAVRLDQLVSWPVLDPNYLYAGNPILANVDGYFYLLLARDLLEGIYAHGEPLLVFPASPPRPLPAPLLSVVTAALASWTGFPIEVVAAVLPVFLGVLLAVPLFYIGGLLRGPVTALSAATFGVLLPYFLYRSGLGWYDTDALNVVLPLSMAVIATWLLRDGPTRRDCVLGGLLYAGLVYLMFRWWDQAPHVVALFSAYPLLLLLALRWREAAVRYVSLLLLSLVVMLMPIGLMDILWSTQGSLQYVSKQDLGIFPNMGQAIGEQRPLVLGEFVTMAAGHPVLFLLSLLGLLHLGRHKPLLMLPLVPFLVVGSFGYFFAGRFLIFLAPVTALGLAGIVSYTLDRVPRQRVASVLAAVAFALISIVLVMAEDELEAVPIVTADVIGSMERIPSVTPQDAVIWSWCDYGYPLSHWGRRPTICDGASHSGEMLTYSAMPLHAKSPRQAANFMYFYVKHGVPGMRRVLETFGNDWHHARDFLRRMHDLERHEIPEALGDYPEIPSSDVGQWAEFLYPEETRPVYLYLDRQTMRVAHWWFWFSTWDTQARQGIHPYYILFHEMSPDLSGRRIRHADGLFDINLGTGLVKFGERSVMLETLNLIESGATESRSYDNRSGWIMDVSVRDRFGVLHDLYMHDTTAHRLYLQKLDSGHFEPVHVDGAT